MNTFKDFEQKAWERKAHLYGDTWGPVTSQPIKRILERAEITNGVSLLDIGCGGGHLCNEAQLLGATVLGCDHSFEMVKIAQTNYPNLSFETQDAEALSLIESSFDIVTLNYLLLHVPDQRKVLLEAKRVLKKNGRLIFTLWKPPAESPGLNLILEATKKYGDTTVLPPADDIFQFANAKNSKEFLESNEFSDFIAEDFQTLFKFTDKESFFSAVLAGTRMGGTIELQRPEVRERIKQAIFSGLDAFKTEDGYVLAAPSVITSARKVF